MKCVDNDTSGFEADPNISSTVHSTNEFDARSIDHGHNHGHGHGHGHGHVGTGGGVSGDRRWW